MFVCLFVASPHQSSTGVTPPSTMQPLLRSASLVSGAVAVKQRGVGQRLDRSAASDAATDATPMACWKNHEFIISPYTPMRNDHFCPPALAMTAAR